MIATPSGEMEKRTRCAACGAWGPAAEYHPFALCALVKAIGEDAARANLKAVVEHSRREAFEEAARVADEFAESHRDPPSHNDTFWTATNLAKAVRSLHP